MTLSTWRIERSSLLVAAAILLYAALRLPLISRDLTFEEPIWLGAGINLVTNFKFSFYYGELDPNFSAFHKPPLLSALLGVFYAAFGGASNSALRSFPFVIGAANFAVALLCVRQWRGSILKAALLYLSLPYLVVCSYYIQIDPTAGLFGYLVLLLASLKLADGNAKATWLFAFSGAWLALSKTEIFIIGGAALSLGLLPSLLRTPTLFIAILLYGVGGAIGIGLNETFSLIVSHSSEGFFQIYQTIIQAIGGIPISRSGTIAERIATSYSSVWEPIRYFGLQWILLLGILGLFLNWFSHRSGHQNRAMIQLTMLASFGLVPVAVYGIGGYVGGAFPRTMVIAVVPLLIASSTATVGFVWASISWISIVVLMMSHLSMTIDVYRSPVSWTEFRGIEGFKAVSDFLKNTLPAGTPILANDAIGFYYRGPYYDYALIESYPDRLAKMTTSNVSEKIGAWVYFSAGDEYSPEGRMAALYEKLKERCQIERTEHIGTMNVALLTKPRC